MNINPENKYTDHPQTALLRCVSKSDKTEECMTVDLHPAPPISWFGAAAIINKCLFNYMKYGLNKETCVYTQSQGLHSWMLGYRVLDPFSHHAIFSRHKCLPAKITWIWIVCSAVQSSLQQESNDLDRQPVCSLCEFNKYGTGAGLSWGC